MSVYYKRQINGKDVGYRGWQHLWKTAKEKDMGGYWINNNAELSVECIKIRRTGRVNVKCYYHSQGWGAGATNNNMYYFLGSSGDTIVYSAAALIAFGALVASEINTVTLIANLDVTAGQKLLIKLERSEVADKQHIIYTFLEWVL